MRQPLYGVSVLDFSRAIAGPWATMALAEMGADVVKVEQPDIGDEVRGWPPFVDGDQSNYFFANNRSKQSIVIDLKQDRGRDLAGRLAAQADVVVENFTPGVADRLGIGYEQVSACNPGVVYCSVSGFGQTGPYRDRKGYDPIVQAMGGIMSVTGDPGGMPCKVGVPVGDLGAALFALQGILASLYHRERTGDGQYIDVSMLDGQVSLLTVQAAIYLASGEVPGRMGRDHPGRVPSSVLTTKDGKYIHLVANDNQWPTFCELLGVPELGRNPRFLTARARVEHREQIMPVLVQAVVQLTRDEIVDRLVEHGIPCGPVNDLDDVIEDPHVQARGMVQTFEHPVAGRLRALGWPLQFSTLDVGITAPPPLLGEHSRSVLTRRLHVEPAELDDLERAGVIQTAPRTDGRPPPST